MTHVLNRVSEGRDGAASVEVHAHDMLWRGRHLERHATAGRPACSTTVTTHDFDIATRHDCDPIEGVTRTALTERLRPLTRRPLAVVWLAFNAVACTADTQLGSAVRRGDAPAVQALLAAGHDANATLVEGWTPLTVAALAGDVPLMTLLVEAGADLNRPKDAWLNQDGRSPLHWAASGGHIEALTFLLDRGALVSTADREGHTPLHAAARGGALAVLSRLLERGASPLSSDRQGLTPLMVAASVAGEEAPGIARVLLTAANNVTAVDERGRSALHWAANTGDASVVRVLVEFGAEVDHQTVDGDTALWWAAAKGHADAVAALLASGANRTTPRADGTTPRAVAVQNGHTPVVALLDAAGSTQRQRPAKP